MRFLVAVPDTIFNPPNFFDKYEEYHHLIMTVPSSVIQHIIHKQYCKADWFSVDLLQLQLNIRRDNACHLTKTILKNWSDTIKPVLSCMIPAILIGLNITLSNRPNPSMTLDEMLTCGVDLDKQLLSRFVPLLVYNHALSNDFPLRLPKRYHNV